MTRNEYRSRCVKFQQTVRATDPASWSVTRQVALGILPANWRSRAGMLKLIMDARRAGTLFSPGTDRVSAYRATLAMMRASNPGPNLP